MSFNIVSKHKPAALMALLVLAILSCLGGVLAYSHVHQKDMPKQTITSSTSSPLLNSSSSNSASTSTGQQTTSSQGQTSTQPQPKKTTPLYVPPPQVITIHCDNYLWDVPFKYTFVAGTGPITSGSNGYEETSCVYSNGTPAPDKILVAPHDEVDYMNVNSADYNTAAKICNNYPAAYFQACMQVIWHG